MTHYWRLAHMAFHESLAEGIHGKRALDKYKPMLEEAGKELASLQVFHRELAYLVGTLESFGDRIKIG